MLNNPGVLAFSTPTYSITENGTPITQVTVTRTGGSDTEVSATITVNNGTATADDYNNTPIKVTFAHGDSAPKIITIPIKEDSQFEAVETIQLSLINPTNGVTIGSQNTAIVKIIDNDNFVFTNTDIQSSTSEKHVEFDALEMFKYISHTYPTYQTRLIKNLLTSNDMFAIFIYKKH